MCVPVGGGGCGGLVRFLFLFFVVFFIWCFVCSTGFVWLSLVGGFVVIYEFEGLVSL